jgi:adenosylcobinamide-GDP ribazoletransferase
MTSFPTARAETRVEDASPALFPLVGLALGASLLALDLLLRELLPAWTASVLVVLALTVLTGAMHLDGLADSADGLFGGRDATSRLAIMDDPRNGAFGFVAVSADLLLKSAALASLSGWLRSGTLLLFPFIARTAVIWLIASFPPARQAGMASQTGRTSFFAATAATVVALIVATAMFSPAGGLVVLGALAVAAAVGLYATRRLGGVTGDVLGASIEVAEVTVLLVAATSAESGWLA